MDKTTLVSFIGYEEDHVMGLIDRVQNRFLVLPFLVNSLPKSGTNLLQKAVGLFPGIASKGNLHIGHSTLALFREKCKAGQESESVLIGVDWPQAVPLKAVQRALDTLKRGHFATGHIPFSEELACSLVDMGMKTVLILRDPRDVVVSHAKYVASTPNHFLYEKYQTLSESERIMKSITGTEQADFGESKLLNIYDRCQAFCLGPSKSSTTRPVSKNSLDLKQENPVRSKSKN